MDLERSVVTGMGQKPQYGGWGFVALVIALMIAVAGAIFTLCRRRVDWQWVRRNVWSICQEWRQRLSWLWAPREEKVGLVKAQHPTAQTVPGLYRQPGNTSQNLLHSDSDLRLDAQGAFTRFEAVDKDLHPPLGNANAIPPQPLRPAPQPRPTGRPRPSPLQAPNPASEYLRMMHDGPGPLTPPPVPPVPRLPGPIAHRGTIGGSVFIFQQPNDGPISIPANDPLLNRYAGNNSYKFSNISTQSLRFERALAENLQSSGYPMTKSHESRIPAMNYEPRYDNREDAAEEADDDADDDDDDNEGDSDSSRRKNQASEIYRNARTIEAATFGEFEMLAKEDTIGRYGLASNGQLFVQDKPSDFKIGINNNDRNSPPIDSTLNIVNEMTNLQHALKNERNTFDLRNSSAHRTIMESIYGPQALASKLHLHNSDNWHLESRNSDESERSAEAYLEKSENFDRQEPELRHPDPRDHSSKTLQKVSQYIESLPDLPVYDVNGESPEISNSGQEDQEGIYNRLEDRSFHVNGSNDQQITPLTSDSPPPPPPAPPDLSHEIRPNSSPTTGERIFSALRFITSQRQIDASEFYNSVFSTAQQQVPRFTLPTITRSPVSLIEQDTTTEQDDSRDEVSAFNSDSNRRGSDLYSRELNLEAHRTAQEVYNSLQDPPASPLLLRDLSQEPYPYMSDPSFTRTSEDIFNSIEQRRKSMERLNGLHEAHFEIEPPEGTTRRRNSQDLYAALEEVQLKRRLSQNMEDPYGIIGAGWLGSIEQFGSSAPDGGSPTGFGRRSSQGLDPELQFDESNLRRAISCESVCSDTSVNLKDLENATVVGHICVGLEHERWGGRGADCEGDLAVSVLEARDLVAPDGRPAQDTLARVCLLPDRETHVQTRLYRGSPSPSYQEKFLFPLDGGPIGRALLVQIFSVEIMIGGGASLLGEASLKLGPAVRPPATTWLPLIGPGAQPIPYHGELMFSLSYLPTAERLTLVVVKARNLRGANSSEPGDFFVKVYLLQQGKKMHKKRTMAKRGEKSPIFNEAIIFSVPPHALQTIQLRLTVAETDPATQSTSKAFSVGHVIVGATATGKSLTHWRHMLVALRRPVAMWHPLRK